MNQIRSFMYIVKQSTLNFQGTFLCYCLLTSRDGDVISMLALFQYFGPTLGSYFNNPQNHIFYTNNYSILNSLDPFFLCNLFYLHIFLFQNRSSSRVSSAGDYLRARQTNQRAKSQNSRYSMGAHHSPSESPRLALRQVDIDIDGASSDTSSVKTPPRERLIPRNNTTPVLLPSLVESSPATSELEVRVPVIDILSKGEKGAFGETHSNKSDTALDVAEATPSSDATVVGEGSSSTKTPEDQKLQIIVGDSDDDGEELSTVSPRLKVGDVVRISETLEGQVRFYGKTQFADGIWVGIALSVDEGMLFVYYRSVLFMLLK